MSRSIFSLSFLLAALVAVSASANTAILREGINIGYDSCTAGKSKPEVREVFRCVLTPQIPGARGYSGTGYTRDAAVQEARAQCQKANRGAASAQCNGGFGIPAPQITMNLCTVLMYSGGETIDRGCRPD